VFLNNNIHIIIIIIVIVIIIIIIISPNTVKEKKQNTTVLLCAGGVCGCARAKKILCHTHVILFRIRRMKLSYPPARGCWALLLFPNNIALLLPMCA